MPRTRGNYYLVAYGPYIRYSRCVLTEQLAMRDCYGLADEKRMTVHLLGKRRNIPKRDLQAYQKVLADKHAERIREYAKTTTGETTTGETTTRQTQTIPH